MSRDSGRPGGTYLAGWLFADLLLVIVLVVLGSEMPAADPHPDPAPTATATATATATPDPSHSPSPTGSVTSRPGGLDPVTVSIGIRLDPGALIAGSPSETAELTRQVTQEIKRYEGRTAAFVMVFGTVRTSTGGSVDTGRSDDYATAVARQLPQAAPRFFPPYSEKIIRGYHDSGSSIASGTARIELFFLLS
ncbi:hypothetical protein [Streptomyces virginiae]|uniref:hypothetical protein n=1 Tax=Streptomyces virginiae TaxID=1961 RepID=UPI00068D9898|nr:hypothetical protein [Streptomyces virginiae]